MTRKGNVKSLLTWTLPVPSFRCFCQCLGCCCFPGRRELDPILQPTGWWQRRRTLQGNYAHRKHWLATSGWSLRFIYTGLTFLYLLSISPLTANSLICLLVNLKRSLIFCVCWYLNFKVSCLNPLQELEDYFYYVQLRGHGIDSLETRQVSTHIPLEEIPSIMRAMGFYPSEEKVGQLLLLSLFKKITKTKREDDYVYQVSRWPDYDCCYAGWLQTIFAGFQCV